MSETTSADHKARRHMSLRHVEDTALFDVSAAAIYMPFGPSTLLAKLREPGNPWVAEGANPADPSFRLTGAHVRALHDLYCTTCEADPASNPDRLLGAVRGDINAWEIIMDDSLDTHAATVLLTLAGHAGTRISLKEAATISGLTLHQTHAAYQLLQQQHPEVFTLDEGAGQ